MESDEVLRVQPLNALSHPQELIKSFVGRLQYLAAVQTLQRELSAHAQKQCRVNYLKRS